MVTDGVFAGFASAFTADTSHFNYLMRFRYSEEPPDSQKRITVGCEKVTAIRFGCDSHTPWSLRIHETKKIAAERRDDLNVLSTHFPHWSRPRDAATSTGLSHKSIASN